MTMLTLNHYLTAAYDLLIGDHDAPVAFGGGAPLCDQRRQHYINLALSSAHDCVYLSFDHGIEDGPSSFQLIFARGGQAILCPQLALWAPPGRGRCSLVSADGARGHQRLEAGLLSFSQKNLASDHSAGIRRGKERLRACAMQQV
ncbi:hypothetical protein [Sphingobium yanoikuyae]|uniref:hypothetical protein n=1 Tax=Sphingobium yanoikuyae TaxID=13690 RepID=UPI0035C6E0F7